MTAHHAIGALVPLLCAALGATGCAESHGTVTPRFRDAGSDADAVRDADAPDGGDRCLPQGAEGTGACAAVLGARWDGRTCNFISGCECVGADCDALSDDLLACYQDRGRLCFGCGAMDAERARPCAPTEDPAPRWLWTGAGCEQVFWCECAGADCDRLFLEQSWCAAAYGGCPVPAPAP